MNFTIVKSSKSHSYVQSKQPRKPHKIVEKRHLTPLELIHSNLYEMNDVLTKGDKRYFMTSVNDASRFCYVCLLKTKIIPHSDIWSRTLYKERGVNSQRKEGLLDNNQR
jgi:hypothetical protein